MPDRPDGGSFFETSDEFKKLLAVYPEAKLLIIYSEEIDPESRSNIQVIKEFRDAFDHLMRANIRVFSGESSQIAQAEFTEYCGKNIDKALSHIFRASCDALDGSVLSLKTIINNLLKPYPHAVIKEVIPDYWRHKIFLNTLVNNIAKHRSEKDIGNDRLSAIYANYIKDVEKLKEFHKLILNAGDSLDAAYREHKRLETIKTIVLVVALLGGIAGILKLFL
jgi:hypothetical protein